MAERRLAIDHVSVEPTEIRHAGQYDLEGLLIRLGLAIDSIGARRVVLDTVESLFASLPDARILRAELRRLFRWLKDRGVTAIVTGERGDMTLTRHGIEEYVSDCVIVLDHRVTEQMSTRRLRVAKYRGSMHGTNEYPFLIHATGINVLPVTSLGLDHETADARTSSGIPALDRMLGGRGFYRGSTILVSGAAGSGKTSVAATFADAACRRGERCLSFLFEESPSQLLRNMRSIGIELAPWVDARLLRFVAARPSVQGLEAHLVAALQAVDEFQPQVVVIDPISSFAGEGSALQVHSMLVRMVDVLKTGGITVLMVNLARAGGPLEQTDAGISSLVDTWLLLREGEVDGSRRCGICVLKSRGMAHSHDVRAFHLTDRGIVLDEPPRGAVEHHAAESAVTAS
jgi:circadian clock protein KaiC